MATLGKSDLPSVERRSHLPGATLRSHSASKFDPRSGGIAKSIDFPPIRARVLAASIS